MTNISTDTLVVLLGLALVAGAIVWHSFHIRKIDLINVLENHNSRLESLLTTRDGRQEILRMLINEAALADYILELEELVRSEENPPSGASIKDSLKKAWDFANKPIDLKDLLKRGWSFLKKNKKDIKDKMLSKINDLIGATLGIRTKE